MWPIEAAGSAAWAALGGANPPVVCRATVIAAFERSCYVETPAGALVCLGSSAIGCGPLNALTPTFFPPRKGESVWLSLAGAQLWQAERPGADRTWVDWPWVDWTVDGPARLRWVASPPIPAEGLGGLLHGVTSKLIRHAQPGIQALQQWLQYTENPKKPEVSGYAEAALAPAFGLLGLGPGLTPSGDDYLCGTLIALQMFGSSLLAQRLWQALVPQLAGRTNRISAAHMAAAAVYGEGHAALHQCLNALCDGNALAPALKALDQVGHSSGWDALAGAVAALQAVGQKQRLN